MGAAWGLLRWISGSVIVASLSHGAWNGLVYALFGFGTRVGALGVQDTALFGPEVGVLDWLSTPCSSPPSGGGGYGMQLDPDLALCRRAWRSGR